MKIRVNGIETNYVVEGSGPWLTMSHSLASNLTMWDEQAQLLSRKFKVLRYDTRGHGQSGAPPAMARQIHENLPGSELLIIASAAHFSNVEQPEVFNQAMLGFLDKHAG